MQNASRDVLDFEIKNECPGSAQCSLSRAAEVAFGAERAYIIAAVKFKAISERTVMKNGNIDPTVYDVVICGGGPAGTAAAIAAAENGEKTLLIEENSELGGTGTSGGVSHWLGGRSRDCTKFVIGGIFQRLVEQAVREGLALLPQPEPCGHSPFGWLPVQDVVTAAAAVKKAYAGTGGTTEAFSCEFSARAAYLALDINTAIADQTRAVSLFAGTEFLAEAKQTLAFYQGVKALKANP